MTKFVYAVKDKRVNAYKPPFVTDHVAEATRAIEGVCNNPESDLNKWPLDYQLDQLGLFDLKTGQFTNDLKEVCQIFDLLKKPRHDNNDPVEPIRKIQ